MKPVKIGICGLGTVGSGTFNLLADNADIIAARAQTPLQVVHVGARRDNPACELGDIRVSRDIFEVARDPEVQILVELIGGTTVARELIEEAIRNRKHVVTANKALIAEFGNEIFALADENNVTVRYEAAVAGGIPIIKALREGLAGNRIEWLAGIINGTGNFILSEMRDKGREFADVLAQAQALGYAEADPTFDVEGIDAAHKLVILASLAFGMPLQFAAVYTEGITRLTPQDLGYAQELGYRIKHLGVARQNGEGVELRVHPTLIPEQRLLANVNGVKNAVLVEGDAVGPTLYYGAGAGAQPTASAVVADLVDLARDISVGQSCRIPALGFARDSLRNLPIVPMEEVETAWYLRMEAQDKPGVMSRVTSIFSEQGISIEGLIQKAPAQGETCVPVIVLTNKVAQGSVDKAVRAIEVLDAINGDIARIRVEALDG
ncbi:MAG TPA: homoserine dehydrogenase [Halieaceae bacterium]|nr:homoserine dehydrogenase [Halieaceae bacterium]